MRHDKEPSMATDKGEDRSGWSARWQPLVATILRIYPAHRVMFVGVNVLLTAINLYTGAPWWGLWPLLITGLVFTVHYLAYKALTVDDAWVEERAADLYDKSYDQGHIDAIAKEYEMPTLADQRDRTERAAYLKAREHRDKENVKPEK